jgi:hypothetical protein
VFEINSPWLRQAQSRPFGREFARFSFSAVVRQHSGGRTTCTESRQHACSSREPKFGLTGDWSPPLSKQRACHSRVSGEWRPQDSQMDPGQVRKPRISWEKPVTWPDTDGIWPSDPAPTRVDVERDRTKAQKGVWNPTPCARKRGVGASPRFQTPFFCARRRSHMPNGPWPGEKTPYFTGKTGQAAKHGIWQPDAR